MPILVVEDQQELLQDIARVPAIKSYAVKQADNRRIDCRMAVDEEYNLVVLNLNLPKLNSLSILKGLRRERLQTAEAILADYPHVLRIFVYADSDAKHKHVEMFYHKSTKDLEKLEKKHVPTISTIQRKDLAMQKISICV